MSIKENWSHVAGICNPADIGSRSISVSVLVNSRLWWEGTHWLVMGEQHWSTELTLVHRVNLVGVPRNERKEETTVLHVAIEPQIGIRKIIDLDRHSTINTQAVPCVIICHSLCTKFKNVYRRKAN